MSTKPNPQTAGEDFDRWVAAALLSRKSTLRPRVGFDELANAAGVSARTAKRHLNHERRGDVNPTIGVGVLAGYTKALRMTIDEVVTEAFRLQALDADKSAQEREAAAAMTPEQQEELRRAQASVQKERRAKPRKQA